ncbi:Zn(II)2Cys6 transcription factor [Aspergillus candidus]|uniref:Zn(2)-C6 fungal-type domain-containing protein n=1 Tax=Aspergillus candidus TaxID=41067 RepID=A0A2I2FAD1_ASPCN|nr:hypothetical protein BDW47DRAFT_106879 [Aspergillus candidus]PLB37594.1 hypothetical protein BDW47DRAFT_106879 [Aspergillus candidus]
MRGCLTCRQRHLKCDKTGTECLRCQRSGRQCVPAPVKPEEVTFRHGQNPSLRPKGPPRYGESDLAFPDDQIWVDMPPEVAFEDETDRTAADYHVLAAGTSSLSIREASEGQNSTSGTLGSPELRVDVMFSLPPVMSDRQKLSNFNESFLLRHFQKTLGAWLDACDHERHFSVDVLERAPSCPLLLYACLAIAARHLSHTTNSIPANTADGYHERCISILLPVLENRGFETSIEILLASTVILRFFEQISSHDPASDLQRHLLAGSVYIGSQVDCATSGGLAEASFWVFVMQDIQFALACRKPLRLTFSPFEERLQQMWGHKSPLADRDWAHKAIWLLAETINYCYKANQVPMSPTALKQKISLWETGRPETFQPLHFALANHGVGRPFPVVWFTNPCHAIAVQHICMAKTLIHEFELRGLYMTPGSGTDTKIIENNILKYLDILFGIALSTDDEPSLRIMACHALCACGTWIRSPLAQNCLLDLLRRTQTENGWPWTFVVQKLSSDWSHTTT